LSVAKTILHGLIKNEEYGRKTLPYLKEEYFKENSDKLLFKIIKDYTDKYSKFPNIKSIAIELSNSEADTDTFDECKETLIDINDDNDDTTELKWLVDKTEEFCQDRAMELAIQKSVAILNGSDKKLTKNAIPGMMQDALSIAFSTNLGHRYLQDAEERYDSYQSSVSRIPFHLEHLNALSRGGLPGGSLLVVLAPTGGGKSIFMTDCAAHNMMDGKNVLYITLELSEDMISERIDANLMDVDIETVRKIKRESYLSKIDKLKSKTLGEIVIEQFPPKSTSAQHIRMLLDELRIKRNFKPDIIYVDYINLMLPSRIKAGSNTYNEVKEIAEELRGVGVIYDVPVVTATQVNRNGYKSAELEMSDTADSFGLPMTADMFIAISTNDELEALNQALVHHLKNRWNDHNFRKHWLIGLDKKRMRFYDLPNETQKTIQQDIEVPVSESPMVKLKNKRAQKTKNFEKFN
jgi:replicative DNA helicase